MEINNEEFEKTFDEAFEQKSEEINSQLNREVLIAMVGDVNCGKSSTINKLMKEDIASVGSKPGETVEIREIPYKDNIIFVDTPGLDDVVKVNSEITLGYYKNSDVILFFLNAAGTVLSENELKNLKDIEKVNRDIIIVLNKIDAADDIPELVKYIQDHTNFKYPVVPISSRTGENISMLQNKLLDILEKKSKDIMFAMNLKEKSTTANRWILAAGVSSATVGASPIPGSDFIPLTGIQVGLMLKLSTLYEKPISKENAKELLIVTVVGNVGKTIFRQIVKFVPGAGSIIGASVAGATTVALGYAIKYMHENNIDLQAAQLKSIYEMLLKKEKEKQEKYEGDDDEDITFVK
ncbi:GTP-binding protein [Lysinibacillus capsici]|uniref:GTP-binding protein n=1 Tax=Lysinibacillus capsici TaxID=2115968 RepID=A0ABY8KL73_9BACI|nr:GTP-binding protein [Lysinibacillus capsici]WGF39860.1 GTP-binding protein [Lysinibacillus capsici]